MSNALKCPNSSCPYLFDPSRVPAGVVLTCPRCGMRFTLGPPAPAGAEYTPTVTGQFPPQPPATGYAAPPPSSPGYPPPSAEEAAFGGMSRDDAEPTGDDRPPRRRNTSAAGESGVLSTVALVFVSLAVLAAVGTMVYFQLVRKKTAGGGADLVAELRERNLSFEKPAAPWATDDETRVKVGSPILFVYKRADPDASMAFGTKDFETREPRPSELRDGLTGPLNKLFIDIRPNAETPDAKWLGQPAIAYTFRARTKGEGPTVMGECHAVSYKGIGYWAICWTGENDLPALAPDFEATRGKFKLLTARDTWVAKEAPVKPFGGHGFDYRVLDAEGIWAEPDRKVHSPTDLDPKANLLLLAKEKKKGRDFPNEATLVVLVLDAGGGDPLAEARKYVEDQRAEAMKAVDAAFVAKFTELTGPPEGDPTPNTVDPTAPVVRLRGDVAGARDQSRLLVISAIKLDEKVVVAYASCAWADRELFDSKLTQIVGSLREAK